MIALLGRTRSWWRQQSAASLLLALAKVYAHVGHDHLSEDCHKTSFPRRLLASRCASYGGWRFLEGDKCATFLSGPSGLFFQVAVAPPQPPKLMLAMATLLETVTSGLPTCRLWQCSRRHFRTRCWVPQGGPGSHRRSSQRPGGGPQGAALTALQGQIQGPRRRHGKAQGGNFCDSWRRWKSTSAARRATLEQICSWAGDDAPSLSKGDWGGQQGARSAPRQLRKAGAHTRNLTLTGSNDGVLWGSEVLGFTPAQLKATRADAAKATYRLSRGQCGHNHDGLRPGCWGEEHRPGFSTSPTSCAGLCDWSLGGRSRPRHNAGRAARLRGQAQPSQETLVRRHGCGYHFRAHVAAAGLEGAVCEAPHHPRWHEDRPLGSGAKDGSFLGRSGFSGVVRQICTLGQFQRAAFQRSHQAAPGFWQAGGVVTVASQRAGQAGFTWDLDTGWAIAASEIGRRPMPALPRRPRHYHRYYECPALQTERDMEVRQAARSLEPQYREQFAHGIFPIPSTILPTASFQQSCPVLWHNRLRRHPGGAHFHGRLLFGQWRFATSRLGGGGSRRRGGPQVSGLWGSAVGRAAWAIITRRRGLRRCHGRTHHLGSAHAAHRLRRYRRDGQRAKVQSFGCRGPPSTRLEQASGFPR